MVKINHKQQVNDGINWKCGVASLEMIFDYYNINYNQDDVWKNIKSSMPHLIGQYYSDTHKMAKYAIEQGLYATVYRGEKDTRLDLLNKINDMGIPAILMVRSKKASHFVVYTGIKNKMYYYSDPDSEREFSYFRPTEIIDVWAQQSDYGVAGYVLVVFDHQPDKMISCQKCKKEVPVVFSSLMSFAEGIACPCCGEAAQIF